MFLIIQNPICEHSSTKNVCWWKCSQRYEVSKWSYYFVKWYNLLCLGWLWWLYRATNSDNSADPEDQNESFWRLGGRKNNPHRVHASRVFFRSQISAIYFCNERHQKARPFHKNIFFLFWFIGTISIMICK